MFPRRVSSGAARPDVPLCTRVHALLLAMAAQRSRIPRFWSKARNFLAVGRKGELQAPPGAARVDLTGKTVIPGLVDAHSHIGS